MEKEKSAIAKYNLITLFLIPKIKFGKIYLYKLLIINLLML